MSQWARREASGAAGVSAATPRNGWRPERSIGLGERPGRSGPIAAGAFACLIVRRSSCVSALPHAATTRHGPPELSRRTGHHGRMAEVDDDQLAALRRLRAAFGFVEVVEVISHDPDDDPAAAPDESMQEARMADPRRMPRRSKSKPTRSLPGRSAIRTGEPPARLSTISCASCWWCTDC
jgi:hypothetical protein